MKNAIEINDVSRQYELSEGFFRRVNRTVTAVHNVSFSVQKGEVFGLLGPNGAGKTTMIKMMSTLLLPTQGRILINDLDVATDAQEIRKRINVVYGGDRGLYYRLSGWENLQYFANLYGLTRKESQERIKQVLQKVDLLDRAHDRVETYSRGMKQRLHIARSLLNDPLVIFLDEPTIGLDPKSARGLREIVKELAVMGKTVLLTTHYMPEVEELCDRMAVIDKGRLVALETPEAIKQNLKRQDHVELTLQEVDQAEWEQAMQLYPQLEIVNRDVTTMRVQLVVDEYLPFVSRLSELFHVTHVADLRVRQSTLEDAYLSLLGEVV